MPSLLAGAVALLLAAPPPADPELARGLAQVAAREYDQGIETLEGVVRRVYGQRSARPVLVRAYVGLGVASVGQGRPEGARDWFAEALALDPRLRLGPGEMPEAARVFEQVRTARERSAAPQRAAAHKKKAWIALGAAAGAGGAVAAVVALEPKPRAGVSTAARLVAHEIACPTGVTADEVPFTVLVDIVPASGAVDVRTGEVTLIPVEAAFIRAGTVFPRPGSLPPAHVGPGAATLAAQTSFPCSRLGVFSTARTELWKAAVTLVTSAGSFYVQTADQLRVEYR